MWWGIEEQGVGADPCVDHTAYVFDEFLQKHEGTICPANGDIKYVHGIVRCILHFEGKSNDDEDDGSVPIL